MTYMEMMQRTIPVKVEVPESFLDYLETCSVIFNRHIDWCFDGYSYNKIKAHEALYYSLRDEFPEIPSCIIQSLRDTALEAVKALKFKFRPTKSPHSAVRYNKNTISLRGNLLTFSWSGKRISQLIKIPKFFKDRYHNWKFQSATIGYNSLKKQVIANLTFTAPTPLKLESDRIVGIDRGLYNIISLSDGQIWSSQQVRAKKREFLFTERQLQAKGTRSSKRKLKARSGREKRFSQNINHVISKWLVSQPYDIFVLEDLTGIRNQNRGRKINNWMANWTFWQLEQFLGYKAEAAGKSIISVDARYTSQKCSGCGVIDKQARSKSRYQCKKCGHQDHADTNAAKNIRANYLHSLSFLNQEFPDWTNEQALVNEPNVSTAMLDTSHQPCAGGN
jgi:putative transposase